MISVKDPVARLVRKRKQPKIRRRPPLAQLKSVIYPWSMRWRLAWGCVILTLLCLALGFQNASSHHFAKFLSSPIANEQTRVAFFYPDKTVDIASEFPIPEGKSILFAAASQTNIPTVKSNLYQQNESGDSIQINLTHRPANKTLEEYEKELQQRLFGKPIRTTVQRFHHPLGQALEVSMENLTSETASADMARYVLILPDDTPLHRQYCLEVTCQTIPTRVSRFVPVFETLVQSIRLVESSPEVKSFAP